MQKPDSFQGWVDVLAEWLVSQADASSRQLPRWERGLVAEDRNGQRDGHWTPIEDFEPRFQEVLRETTRDWVNLTVERVEDGILYAVVEYIARDDPAARDVPPDQVSVNVSGPPHQWLEALPDR